MDTSIKDAVWLKGRLIPGFASAMWRWDDFGYPIRYSDFGKRSIGWGWEIAHIVPLSQGGTNNLSNLRPLHWISVLKSQENRGSPDLDPT